MGDSNDGSSIAAQSAREEDTSEQRGTFLSRIIGALSPGDAGGTVRVSTAMTGGYATGMPVPGMMKIVGGRFVPFVPEPGPVIATSPSI